MDSRDFKQGLEELRRYYGEAAYPPGVAQIIWNFAHKLTYGEFQQVIERLVEEFPRTPTVASIRKACGPMLRTAASREAQDKVAALEAQGQSCRLCRHSGLVEALDRKTGSAFSFRCPSCPAAKVRRLSLTIPEWTPGLEGTYLPVTQETLAQSIAMVRTKSEQLVLLTWLKRVRKQPGAAKAFTEAGGVLPAQVIEALLKLGIDCGPVDEALAKAEVRVVALQKMLAEHQLNSEVPF